ncbi:TPR repeat-containing protein, partial [mine drainage metagenome]
YRLTEPEPVRPVYIVGMPRSGTTLIEQMLSAHYDIASCGEMVALQSALCRGLEIPDIGQLPFALNPLKPAAWRHLRSEVDRLYAERSRNRKVLTDKMPSNFMNLGFLTALYPNARVIHIQREARDTCVSCYTTLFRSSQRFTSNLTHLGRYFRMYEAIMDYWRSILPATTLLEIRYETLVGNPRESLERILDFIGLPWQEDCLYPERSDRRILTASLFQARQPIRTSSIGRWQHYARYLGPLEAALAIVSPLEDPPAIDANPVPE